ncbi:DEAD/DEAH box helicase [Halobacillus litoralis]|uniref:DEAD/DEAH box helicase n=1 Tax=Halobacillus litoralis TaxID=45668 RepID=UPI001CD2C322|nr:DEAD/DEAH box helicase [Halobacillus litoralis]MCA1021251.1 DEAD/DEAH box helicase [Halobacillus litoralis]
MLLSERIITKTESMEQHLFQTCCRRCGNAQAHLFAELPHQTCRKTCVYCRNCIQMGRVLECEPLYIGSANVQWPVYEDPCAWKGTLTPGQQRAADDLTARVQKGSGEHLVWAVCGAGKTEVLFPAITKALETGKRICLATPRTDVVRELQPRLQKAFPEVDTAALYGDSPDKDGRAPFVIATTHQLIRYAHAFDVLIIDEVDAFPFHNDPTLHFAAKRAAMPDAAIIYLTATPRKEQKRRLRQKSLPVTFIPRRFHGHPLPVPALKLTPMLHRSLNKGQLPAHLLRTIAAQQTTARQLLLFLPSIKKAEEIASFLKEAGYEVKSVHAEDDHRAEKIQSFRNKEYRILVTTTILERGVTFPSVDVYVIDAGHVVFDEAALVQIAGRAGRSADDPDGDVRFYHIGKTDEMLDAVEAVKKMNKLGQKL